MPDSYFYSYLIFKMLLNKIILIMHCRFKSSRLFLSSVVKIEMPVLLIRY